jgi:hypothetical protein
MFAPLLHPQRRAQQPQRSTLCCKPPLTLLLGPTRGLLLGALTVFAQTMHTSYVMAHCLSLLTDREAATSGPRTRQHVLAPKRHPMHSSMLNKSRKCLILRRALYLAPSIARLESRANATHVRVGWSAGHRSASAPGLQMDHHQASAESSPRILAHAWKHRHHRIGVSLLREHDSRSL